MAVFIFLKKQTDADRVRCSKCHCLKARVSAGIVIFQGGRELMRLPHIRMSLIGSNPVISQ